MAEKLDIKNRFTGEVIFTAELTCSPDTLPSVKLGLAVKAAIVADANLARANLADANLTRANLTRANLTRAYLADANLADANLARANLAGANLADANLTRANLTRANLTRAYLADANLADANLTRAYLAGANLAGANLVGAYLVGAYLVGVEGLTPERVTHLASLKFMPAIHAFKLVNSRGESPFNGGLKYKVGKRVAVKNADANPSVMCSAGIHVADLPWCLREWSEGYRILLVAHSADDIACVPLGTDGKYRLHGCTPLRDITDELRECGALPKLEQPEPAHSPA